MKLSVSQVREYERCPYAWYLARVEKAWKRPAAWLPQGTAVHAAIEAWERSNRVMTLDGAQDVFRTEYSAEVEAYTKITPNLEWWYASGPYRGPADLERRYTIGLGQVEKYITWATNATDEVIWVDDNGKPSIELDFDIELDGIAIRGYIDAIIERDGVLVVRDHKTGNNPGDDFQLGAYSVAIESEYGFKPEIGDYWMGKTGRPTKPYDLTKWTKESVGSTFSTVKDGIEAGKFPPLPEESKCRFCNVSYACKYAYQGR